jgi:hypothetical protein
VTPGQPGWRLAQRDHARVAKTIIGDDELRELAQVDIFHEVNTLCWWVLREIAPFENDAEWLRKARTEIALLHLRSLAHFLRDDRPKDDSSTNRHLDVVADHFFVDTVATSWDRPRARPMFTRLGNEHDEYLKVQIDRHLAHVTRDRYLQRDRSDQSFNYGEVDVTLVLDEFVRFVNELKRVGRTERADWHRRSVQSIEPVLSAIRGPRRTVEIISGTNSDHPSTTISADPVQRLPANRHDVEPSWQQRLHDTLGGPG